MDKKQAARIKNILEGNYNGNTSLQIGYDRSVTHKEGDEWEEDDKKWTISTAGNYVITANIETLTFSFIKQ